jgi:DNA invertase Pin-like site-specific DNA recombinase
MGCCCSSETEAQAQQRVQRQMAPIWAELDQANAAFNAREKEISEAKTTEELAAIAKKYGWKWPPPKTLD